MAAASQSRVAVVVAPDSFKGSLSAAEAADAIAAGARAAAIEAGVEVDLRLCPVSDGGEGLVEVTVAAGYDGQTRTVTGPLGDPVQATFAVGIDKDGKRTAVVELAAASGLGRLPGGRGDSATARTATTRGTGELVAAALDADVGRVVLGLGGSATTDGGTGLATALGARFLDSGGAELASGGAALRDLDRIDLSRLEARLSDIELLVACDVDNPLTGPRGAAAVYGPQKGAGPDDVVVLDAGLVRLTEVMRRDLGIDVAHLPGAGAAGGVGAGAMALLGARLTPGIDLVLDLVDFDTTLAGAGLVLTGEGSVDAQSLAGKAPVGVARRAHAAGVPVVVLAGSVSLDGAARAGLAALGVVATYGLLDLEPDLDVAVRDAHRLLRGMARHALTDWVRARVP